MSILRHLTPANLLDAARAAVLLPFVARRVRRNRFARESDRQEPATCPTVTAAEARRLAAITRRVCDLMLPGRPACLVRALLLQQLLARRGADTRLRVGVRLNGEALHAHAWVEFQGEPLGESPAHVREYAKFPGALESPGA